jgi:hypothetical protein
MLWRRNQSLPDSLPFRNFTPVSFNHFLKFILNLGFHFCFRNTLILFSSLVSINLFSSLFLFNMLFTLFTNLIYCTFIYSLVLLYVLRLCATLFAYFIISLSSLFCPREKGLLEKARRGTGFLRGWLFSLSETDMSVTLDWFSLVWKAL